MSQKNSICQSCSIPLSKDKGIANEVDGSRNLDYCSFCYQNGTFTEPNITVEEMQEKVLYILKQMYIPRFLGKFFTKNIPTLKRWKK